MVLINSINRQRKDDLAIYLNTIFPKVLSTLITGYDYYYDDNECSTIAPSELDIDRLFFKPKEDDPMCAQIINFINYLHNYDLEPTQENLEKKGRPLIVVTKPIKITHGGIPRYDSILSGMTSFRGPDDTSRAWFYIPRNDDSKELFDMVQKIDDYMHNEINVQKNQNGILNWLHRGKKICLRGLTYHRMITTYDQRKYALYDDDVKKIDPWDRIKVKFSTVYDETLGPYDPKKINTRLFIGDKIDSEPCVTLSDFEKYFEWRSTVQFALMFSKLWISKEKKYAVLVLNVYNFVSQKRQMC